jgi:hypothetical protein
LAAIGLTSLPVHDFNIDINNKMKETVKAPPSNTLQSKENSGSGKQFFSPGSQGSFFNSKGIQPKLNIGQKDDKYEKQADAMADKVVSRSSNTPPGVKNDPAVTDPEERLNKKEEERDTEKDVRRQPMFESEGDGEGNINRSIYPENDEGERVFRSENDAATGNLSKGDAIVAIARSKLGKVKAKASLGSEGGKQLRFGYETLLEIFHLSAPGTWDDNTIKYLDSLLPSWCGIFAVYCIKKAGIDIGNWQMGKGVSSFGKLQQTTTPQAGDIGYMDTHQHHAIIVKVEGDIVHSIDGNSGLQSEIIENKRPAKAYRGFFTALHNTASDGNVQKKENPASQEETASSVEDKLQASKGQGSALDNKTRGEMESSFGADFSGVKVHTGGDAAQLSNDLNAQAFTHGKDIYFNEGKYKPETSSGKHLLAHELTHTVQQNNEIQKKLIQRNPQQPGPAGTSSINFDSGAITLPKISMPGAKSREDNSKLAPPFKYPKGYERKNSYKDVKNESSSKEQREVLTQAVTKGVTDKVNEKTQKAKADNAYDKDTDTYFFKHKNRPELRLIGKPALISEYSSIPTWTRNGKATAYDVDHVRELQLEGKNFATNMELLHFSLNRAAGNAVKLQINSRIDEFIQQEEKKNSTDFQKKEFPKTNIKAKDNFDIVFNTVDFTIAPTASGKEHYWSLEEITAGKHLDSFDAMTSKEIKAVQGSKGDETINTSPIGGVALKKKDIKEFNDASKKIKFSEPSFIENQTGKKAGEEIGSFNMDFGFYGSKEDRKKFKVPVLQMDGVLFGGSIPRRGQSGTGGLEQLLVGLDLPGMSPVTVDEAMLVKGKGLAVRGRIHPTIDIIQGIDLDFFIEGDDFGISKTFSAGEIKVPPPFKINDISLTIKAGTSGYGILGNIDFEVTNVGQGKIKGTGGMDSNFGISGHFAFDKKIFSGGAEVEMSYNTKEGWAVKGKLGLKKGNGIKKGNVDVSYANQKLTATGSAELDIKGVKDLTIKSEITEDNFTVEGDATLGTLPGVKSGNVHAKLSKQSGGDYEFSASGTADLDAGKIKGLKKTEVKIAYRNGGFDIGGTLDFEYDKLTGSVTVNVSNLIDGEGKPTDKAQEKYNISGTGKATLKLSDKLKVSVNVKLLPSGEMELTGKVDYEKEIVLFPSPIKKWKKSLLDFKIPPMTLFGLPHLADVVLTAGVDMGVHADISDGVLSGLYGEITYSPGHPEKTKAEVGGSFGMTAEAGVYLSVHGGLGLRVAVATMSGNIAVTADATLPLKIGADAKVKWTPETGFDVDAKIFANITPKFTVRLGAYAELDIDYFVGNTSVRWPSSGEYVLADQTWLLNSLTIGAELPVKYKEKEGFNLDTKDLNLTYPKSIETDKLIDDFVKPLKDKML